MYTPRSTKGVAYFKSLAQVKKSLRFEQTDSEDKFWQEVRTNKLGFKFKRQHIVHNFIVDFYCVEKCLSIEIDGEVHNKQKIRDEERDSRLELLGVRVIRFTNDQIDSDIGRCIMKVKEYLNK